MNDHVKAYLSDILYYASSLTDCIAGRSLDEYLEDKYFRWTVERQLELMCDTVGQLLKTAPEYETYITHARRVVDFRNRLAHGYRTLINEVVWDVAQRYVPPLETEVAALLSAAESETQE